MCRDGREATRDLHRCARERQPSTQSAVQTERSFTSDRRHFDHFSVATDDEERNHAALREINAVNAIARFQKDDTLRYRSLFELRFQKSQRLSRQRRQKAVFSMSQQLVHDQTALLRTHYPAKLQARLVSRFGSSHVSSGILASEPRNQRT